MKRNILSFVLFLVFSMNFGAAHADTASFDKQMQPILEQYLKIPKALATDKTNGVKPAAEKIAALASKLDSKSVTGEHAAHYKYVPANLKVAATKLAAAKDIAAMREALKELSKPLAMWATMSKPKGVSVMYCSMAPGSWLQKDDTQVANPYYGAKMLRCGEIVAGSGAGDANDGMKHDGSGMKHGDGNMQHGGHGMQ